MHAIWPPLVNRSEKLKKKSNPNDSHKIYRKTRATDFFLIDKRVTSKWYKTLGRKLDCILLRTGAKISNPRTGLSTLEMTDAVKLKKEAFQVMCNGGFPDSITRATRRVVAKSAAEIKFWHIRSLKRQWKKTFIWQTSWPFKTAREYWPLVRITKQKQSNLF